MSDVICPRCGSHDLVGLVAGMTNTYRCEECGSMSRMWIEKPPHTARPPHPDTMAGK